VILATLLLTCATLCVAEPPAGTPVAGQLAPAAGRFLVARRDLYAPFFSRSVIYLVQHNSTGSVGVIVNRPLGKSAAELLPDLQEPELSTYPVYIGGPVNPRIIVLLFRGNRPMQTALHVSDGVYASSDSAVLAQLIVSQKPVNELRMFAGQAGWLPGQLSGELAREDWYVTEGDPDVLFSDNTGDLWRRLIDRLDPQGIMVLQHAGDTPAPRS
jgi:putative transcriptional regulator